MNRDINGERNIGSQSTKGKKYLIMMDHALTKISTLLLILSFSTGLAQERKTLYDSSYDKFQKEVYTKVHMPPGDCILEECLFDGFLLTYLKIDESGQSKFTLLYYSHPLLKDYTYESLKKLKTGSLDNNKTYLIPIVLKVKISEDIDCKPRQYEQDTSLSFKSSRELDIDYYFKPFIFPWITPIS